MNDITKMLRTKKKGDVKNFERLLLKFKPSVFKASSVLSIDIKFLSILNVDLSNRLESELRNTKISIKIHMDTCNHTIKSFVCLEILDRKKCILRLMRASTK